MFGSIRGMEERDRARVLEMMRDFYASPAVLSGGSEEIFNADIDHCVGDCPYIEGYIFEDENTIQGYAMVAKSYSAEFGRPCIWVEDLYIREAYRGQGIGSGFLRFLEHQYPDAVFRLEVEEDNERAVKVYQKMGYEFIPYKEMKKTVMQFGELQEIEHGI